MADALIWMVLLPKKSQCGARSGRPMTGVVWMHHPWGFQLALHQTWALLFHSVSGNRTSLPRSSISEEKINTKLEALRYCIEKGHKAALTASCCQGENTVLPLPRSPWGAEMVRVSSPGGPAGCLYQILMFLYETQMLILRTSVSTTYCYIGAICLALN